MKYYIYLLLEPDTKEIRYVGKSTDPQKRFYGHIYDKSKSHKASWIKSLVAQQKLPVLQILECFDTEEECFKAEMFYIDKYRKEGIKLTNLHNGGLGGSSEYVRGSKSGSAKVSEETVLQIASEIIEDKLYITDIARKYNVSSWLIYNIKRGVTWSHITGFSKDKPVKRQANKLNRVNTFKDKDYNKDKSISVEQYTLDGQFICNYQSINQAHKKSGETRDNIVSCINGNKSKTLKFLWKRVNIN